MEISVKLYLGPVWQIFPMTSQILEPRWQKCTNKVNENIEWYTCQLWALHI